MVGELMVDRSAFARGGATVQIQGTFMKRVTSKRCLGVVLGMGMGLSLLPLGAPAVDWPQWRGPQRDGISKETGLLAEWPKEGPRLVWQVKDIGSGYSTPSVVGDRLYL